MKEWTKQYGKVYGIYEGLIKVLVVSDLDMLQELFIKKFDYFHGRKNLVLQGDVDNDDRVHVFEARGLRWKRLRALSNPTFSSSALKKIHGTVEDSALELVRLLSPQADRGAFNIHVYYQELTMDIICRIALGQRTTNFFNNPLVNFVSNLFMRSMRWPPFLFGHLIPPARPFIKWTFLKIARLFGLSGSKIYEIATDAVHLRLKQREEDSKRGIEPGEPADFIDLFIDAVSDEKIEDGSDFSKSELHITKRLTTPEIIAQCFVFLLAGFDTTANSLAYASYLLAKHPEKQKRLIQEVDEYCKGETIEYETLGKLKYMDCVAKEALRLYPLAAFASSRTCMKDTTLGDIEIEKETTVVADVWTIHRDKTIWGADAEEFVPERWENPSNRHIMSWFPFGAGPRTCIGMRLAYMEEKLALAHILKRFEIVAGPETEAF
ncbi:hypothetical protein WR25_03127 isoform D [Diploscapter pachys]|uniref:Cytochrome P450 n=1 Tax=Diploscapter pachys TaxID=2018661 RepID=A0A2A2JIS6_9BILA|nr:hypothetical protein WR25_03127 isoform B [Diploscapter pachys]PAV61610.1 hypothetical protein WR25_03127 isoform D [Diploscapter pachys]